MPLPEAKQQTAKKDSGFGIRDSRLKGKQGHTAKKAYCRMALFFFFLIDHHQSITRWGEFFREKYFCIH